MSLLLDLNLEGKSVLITGSSRGIGKGIAGEFINNGANVILNGTNSIVLKEVLKELNLQKQYGIEADVTNFDQAKFLLQESERILQKIDIIICNVGSGKSVRPGEEDYSEWERVFKKNFWSTTNIVEAGKNALQKTKGIFICISSICGHEVIDNAPITYSTAKAALNFYIKSVSRPLANKGIRINGISPGNIYFKGSSWEEKIKEKPELLESTLQNVPLSRFGTIKDISNMCMWLASDYSSFCTGSIFKVDGGQLRN